MPSIGDVNSASKHGPAVTGVDTHVHILRVNASLAADRHSAPSRDTTVPELFGLLDAQGLSHAVLTAPSFYGEDNTVLLDALAQGESRLLGTITAGPETSVVELQRLARSGVRGIRCNLIGRPETGLRTLAEKAAATGLHLELLAEADRIPALGASVLAAGGVLVLDHFGLDADLGFVLEAVAGGDTWVKLSAPYRLPNRAVAADRAAELLAHRPDRLLWGSDWPWVSHEHEGFGYSSTVDWLGEWVPEEHLRRAVLADNPARLFGLAAAG